MIRFDKKRERGRLVTASAPQLATEVLATMPTVTGRSKAHTRLPGTRGGGGAAGGPKGWLCMLLLSTLSIGGVCQSAPKNATPSDPDLETLQRRIADLETQIEMLRNGQKADSENIRKLTHASAFLDTSSPKGFERVDTEVGPLLISLGQISPDRDGFKVKVNIGISLAGVVNGLVLNARWGPHRPKGDGADLETWLNSSKVKTFSIRNTLYPGKWNHVSIVIPESDPSRFESIEISIHVDAVTLQP